MTEQFNDFPQSFQANDGIVRLYRTRLLPLKSFLSSPKVIIMPYHVTVTNMIVTPYELVHGCQHFGKALALPAALTLSMCKINQIMSRRG
jgi:hypothetical protein